MKKVTVIDYGAGNLMSVKNALCHLGCEVVFCDDPVDLKKAKNLILPGVGAFKAAADNLFLRGFAKEIPEYIINEVIEKGDTDAIANNKAAIMDTINAGLKRYALEVEAKLRELKIDFDFTNVVYVGGGAGVMRRFGSCTGDNVRYVTDVRANALGYQYLAQNLV